MFGNTESFFHKDVPVTLQTPVVIETPINTDALSKAVAAAVREALRVWIDEFKELVSSEPLFYTDRTLADKLGIAELTVQRLRRAGKINYKRVSGKAVYTRKHIEEFLAK